MIKKIFCTALLIMSLAAPAATVAQTPAEVLGKAASRIDNAKGVSCRFTVRGNGESVSGTLVASGNRFCIKTPGASTWYDGKTMWTLNNSTKEVTVTEPTAAEVAETNPLSYLHGYNSAYRLFFSRRTEKGRHLVLLNPRKTGTGIKAVEIAIDSKTFDPVRMTVRFDDDRRSVVDISGLRHNAAGTTSFTFPASSYKGYEIVDLR